MEGKTLTNQKSQKNLKASWGDQMENLPVQTPPQTEGKKLKRTESVGNFRRRILETGEYVLCVDTKKNRLWLNDKQYIDILNVAKEQKISMAENNEFRDLRFRKNLGYEGMNAYLSASLSYNHKKHEIKVAVNQTPEFVHSERLTFIEIFVEETKTYIMFSVEFEHVKTEKTKQGTTVTKQFWRAVKLEKLTLWPDVLTNYRKFNQN